MTPCLSCNFPHVQSNQRTISRLFNLRTLLTIQLLTYNDVSVCKLSHRRTCLCATCLTISCFMSSPSIACNITELEDLIRQLPPPFLLLWDFNAHSQQWGSNKRSTRGKMVDNFLLKSNLCLLNSGSPTYLHPSTASFSAIDFSIAHPTLYLDFCWQIDADLHGSDHSPIVITTDTPSPSFAKSTWKLRKADWAAFTHQAALELCTDTICSAEDPIQQFTDVVINIANNSIPKSKPTTKKQNTIWCNEDCKAAIKTRNKALKRVQKHLTQHTVDYCSSTLAGVSSPLLQRLQSVLNAAARLVFSARRSERITPLLRELHWFKVSERIQFRLCSDASLPPWHCVTVPC